MPGEAYSGGFLSLFPPSRGLTKSELSLRAYESEGSDYTIPETDAGAARTGGNGQGQLHGRARTLAVAHTHLPDSSSPRPPPPHLRAVRTLLPASPLAVALVVRASRSLEPPSCVRDAGLWEVRGLDSRRRRCCRRYVPPEVLCFEGPVLGSQLLQPRGRFQGQRGSPIGGTGGSENGCQRRSALQSNGKASEQGFHSLPPP